MRRRASQPRPWRNRPRPCLPDGRSTGQSAARRHRRSGRRGDAVAERIIAAALHRCRQGLHGEAVTTEEGLVLPVAGVFFMRHAIAAVEAHCGATIASTLAGDSRRTPSTSPPSSNRRSIFASPFAEQVGHPAARTAHRLRRASSGRGRNRRRPRRPRRRQACPCGSRRALRAVAIQHHGARRRGGIAAFPS